MPSAKSGTACTLVSPTDPQDAQEADDADPGTMSDIKADQRQTQSGKYGSVPVKAFNPSSDSSSSSPSSSSSSSAAGSQSSSDDQTTHWIEIVLVGEDGKPIAGEPYQITLPDQSVASGTTDGNGSARVDGIPDAGSCQITFPKRDQEAWQPA